MIIKVLGTLDILVAVFVWLAHFFNIIPEQFILLIAILLLVKGVFFIITSGLANIVSIVDVVIAAIILLSLNFHIPDAIIIIIVLFLLQKGIFSWLG